MKIEIRIGKRLKEQKRSFYWLAKETGISHSTLWRLKKGKALGINFVTLEKICQALGCAPGDILKFPKTSGTKQISKTHKSSD